MPTRVYTKFTKRAERTTSGWRAERELIVSGPTSEIDVYNAIDAETGLKLPAIGDQHPETALLLCTSVEVQQQDLALWLVRAEYRTVGTTFSFDPLGEPASWRWQASLTQEPVDRDAAGNPILNSAGDPFDDNPTNDFFGLVLIVRINEPLYDPRDALSIMGRINADTLLLFGSYVVFPGQMRCLLYQPVMDQTRTSTYVTNEYHFEFRENFGGLKEAKYSGFHHRLLDQGFRGWYTGNKRDVFYHAPPGDQVSDPVLLDGTGKPIDTSFKVGRSYASPIANPSLPAGMTVDPGSPASAKFLIYSRCLTANFKGLIPGIM